MPRDVQNEKQKRDVSIAQKLVGEFVRGKIKSKARTFKQIDRACEFESAGTTSRIVNGRQRITAEIASKLYAEIGASATFWATLDTKLLAKFPDFSVVYDASDETRARMSEAALFMESEFTSASKVGEVIEGGNEEAVAYFEYADGRVARIPKSLGADYILKMFEIWANSEGGPEFKP